MIIFLVLLLLCTSAIWAGPDLPPVEYLINPDGSENKPWQDDGGNTITDGGRTLYFTSSGGGDGNPCTRELPCASLSKVRSSWQSRDNILFKRGSVYNGQLQAHQAPSGTASDWTIFGVWGSSSDPLPKFNGTKDSTNFVRKSYIQMDRLNFTNHNAIRFHHGTHHIAFTRGKNHNNVHTCFNISNKEGTQYGVGLPHHITIAASGIGGCGIGTFYDSNGKCKVANDGVEGFYLGSSAPNKADWGAEDVHGYNNRIFGTSKEPVNYKTRVHRFTFEKNLIENISMCDDPGVVSGHDFTDIKDVTIDGNIIRNINHQEADAGAVFLVGMGARVTNNLVYKINSKFDLVSIHPNAKGTARIIGNTFWDFGGKAVSNSSDSSQNQYIKNNLMPSVSGNLTPQANMFKNPNGGDFRLSETSSALDVYNNCEGLTRDIQGNVRPTNGKCDAGASELGIAPVGIAVVSLSLGGDFPSTVVRDNFNRADENPLGGASTIVVSTDNVMQLLSNKAAPTTGISSAHWTPNAFNGPQEVFGTMVQQQASSRAQLFACLQGGIGTSGVDGYELRARRNPTNDANILEIFKIENGFFSKLGGSLTNPPGLTYPAQIGMRIATNGDIEVFVNGNSLGVVWNDTTYSCTNTRIGLGGNNAANTIDDFGGGTYTETNPVLVGIETLTASCTDDDGVAQICFKVNGSSIGCDSTAPYSLLWDTQTRVNGTYSMTATCRDTSNEIIETQPITFTINNAPPEEPEPTKDTTPPVTTITTPPPSSVFGLLLIEASCTDNAGCAEVDFRVDGVSFGTDIATPPETAFSKIWNTEGVQPGVYNITAVGKDYAGNTHTSAPLLVVVVALYPVIEDATVCEIPATCGHSSRVANVVRHTASNEFRTYLKFDISTLPAGAIVDAVLTLNVAGLVAPANLQVFASSSDAWTEESINWGNAPALGAELDEASIGVKGNVSWKITSFADAALASDKIISVVLRDKNTTGKGFHLDSKEQGDLHPRLVLTRGLLDSVAPTSATLTLPNKVDGTYENASVEWTGTCADALGIHRAELHADGVEVMSDIKAPYGGTWVTGFTSNQTRTMKVVCFDYGGNELSSATQSLTIDVTPPTVSNPMILAVNGTQLVAKWDTTDAHSGTTATADINRCNPAPCTPCLHATANANPYTMTFSAPDLDRISDWTIQAIDKVGNRSVASAKVTAGVSDLVALFKFNNNCNDDSLTGNNCTLNGNAGYVTSSGKQVLTVDGTGDYARAVDHEYYTRRNALSVVASINCDNRCADNQYIVAENKISERTFSLFRTTSAALAWQIFNANTARSAGGAITNQIPATGWIQVAGVFTGSVVQAWKDATLIQGVSFVGTIDEDIVDLVIGASSVPGNYWNGLIGPVYVYNKALSQIELSYLHSLGVP